MGAQNVGLAYARWGALNHAPFRVLVYMAYRSLDSGNPPIFYAGRDEVASAALGRPIPEPGPEFEKQRKADWAMVKKIIRDLSSTGAIKLIQAAGPSQNAVYELNLIGIDKSYPQGGGGTSVPPSGGTSGTRMVVPQVRYGGTSGSPLGGEGVLGVVLRRDGEGDQQPAGFAHTREDEKPDEINGMAKGEKPTHSDTDCPTCDAALDPDGSCFICRTPARKGIYA